MKRHKAVRLIKKVRLAPGQRKFITVAHDGNRYFWDPRPGVYFLEWWEGQRRRRERAGLAPSEALEALRRKRLQLAGALALAHNGPTLQPSEGAAGTAIPEAIEAFL